MSELLNSDYGCLSQLFRNVERNQRIQNSCYITQTMLASEDINIGITKDNNPIYRVLPMVREAYAKLYDMINRDMLFGNESYHGLLSFNNYAYVNTNVGDLLPSEFLIMLRAMVPDSVKTTYIIRRRGDVIFRVYGENYFSGVCSPDIAELIGKYKGFNINIKTEKMLPEKTLVVWDREELCIEERGRPSVVSSWQFHPTQDAAIIEIQRTLRLRSPIENINDKVNISVLSGINQVLPL